MAVPILCLVCLCLVMWVMLLKTEVYRLTLKYEGSKEPGPTEKPHVAKGTRTFSID